MEVMWPHVATFLQQVQETEKLEIMKPGNCSFMGSSHFQPLQDETGAFDSNRCGCSRSWPATSIDSFLTSFKKPYNGKYCILKGKELVNLVSCQTHTGMVG